MQQFLYLLGSRRRHRAATQSLFVLLILAACSAPHPSTAGWISCWNYISPAATTTRRTIRMQTQLRPWSSSLWQATKAAADSSQGEPKDDRQQPISSKRTVSSGGYDLGLGKNKPLKSDSIIDSEFQRYAANSSGNNNGTTTTTTPSSSISTDPPPTEGGTEAGSVSPSISDIAQNWAIPEPVIKPPDSARYSVIDSEVVSRRNTHSRNVTRSSLLAEPAEDYFERPEPIRTRRMVARDEKSRLLRGALWDEQHYGATRSGSSMEQQTRQMEMDTNNNNAFPSFGNAPPYPSAFYPDIDLSIPDSVYKDDGSVDLVWDLLRWEAYQNVQEQHEPLLVSFLHSSILNHDTLESSLAFLLANRLQSPAMMISTQLQALILSALNDCPVSRRSLRADIMAVRDRDPACNTLPDVFLYFKGFHALQSHRVASVLWKSGRHVLSQFLQSQVSQIFQIDIHPNATMGMGIMLDHGTGIVVGETAMIGHNCSILHHVTLGGSGKKGVVRHPSIGDGVLLGAGATVLGPVRIGEGSQVGAGTLVIASLPAHCVAVGVPARVIGSFVDVTEQPSIGMNQIMDDKEKIVTFESDGI